MDSNSEGNMALTDTLQIFFFVQKKLAVEIDGKVHCNKDSIEYDLERDEFIKGFGIKVLRFRNEDIERDIDKVLKLISEELI